LYDSFNQTEVGYCGTRLPSPGSVSARFLSYRNKIATEGNSRKLALNCHSNHFSFPYIKLYLDFYAGNTFLGVWFLP
jgi:hypothetical protein